MTLGDFKNSNTFRVLFIGFLILLLLIPMGMVKSIISERGHLYRQANNEITAAWGKQQLLIGPILTIPYVKTFSDNSGWSYDSRYRHLRPEEMTVNTHIETQMRYRSIYKVPVYIATVHINGHFNLQKTGTDSTEKSGFQLNEGSIQIPVKSSRSLKEPIKFVWDDEVIKLTPGWDDPESEAVIFTAKIPYHLLVEDQLHKFELDIKLAGSGEFSFISSSQNTRIKMNSNWHSPGFNGIYLPSSHDVSDKGFTAAWQTNDLLTDIGHREHERVLYSWFSGQPGFGVKFIQPVDTYQLITRAAKYAVLFISLTFLVYFLAELFGKAILHPIQYLLVGVANCIFYLLLLSLAEHINFNIAYFFSASASIALISLYSSSILNSRLKASIVFVVLSCLYTYLFVTLRSEAFALLIGSIGLFVILGLSMYLTRNIDWHRVGNEVD
jgi:inner membrane protein